MSLSFFALPADKSNICARITYKENVLFSLQIVISFRLFDSQINTRMWIVYASKVSAPALHFTQNVDSVLQLIYDCMQLWLFITWQMNNTRKNSNNKRLMHRTRNEKWTVSDAMTRTTSFTVQKNNVRLFTRVHWIENFIYFCCCCCCCLHQHDRIMCARVNTKRKTLICSSSRKKPHRPLSTISQTSAAKIKTKWAQTRSDLLSTNWLGILLNIFLLLPILISIFSYLAKWNFMFIIMQSSSENLNFFVFFFVAFHFIFFFLPGQEWLNELNCGLTGIPNYRVKEGKEGKESD